MVFYAVIPILCCVMLVIWALRHSSLSEMLSKKMEGAAIQLRTSLRIPEEQAENVYTTESTVPKVCITNDLGRRHTFVFEELNSDSDVEVYNRNHFKRPSIIDRSLGGLYEMGNTNEGFIDDEGSSIMLRHTGPIQETESNETEHFYDTVKSDKSSRKRIIEEITEL